MARYDGSPDAFPGVRDGHRDLNLDRWPDPPAVEEEPAAWRTEPDPAAMDEPSDTEDTLVGVVDLRSPANPADWATSYESGVYTSSFTFDAPLPPLPADPAAPGAPVDDGAPAAQGGDDAPYEGRRRHGAVQEPPAPTAPVTSIAPPPAAAPEPTTVIEPELPATTYEAPPASYEPPPSYERSPEYDDPGSATTRTDWNIPPTPMGPPLSGADSLTADSVLRFRRERPQSGWRRSVYEVSRGKVNLGPSRADRRRAEMVAAARTPIAGCHRLAVISLKGGVGKTTTTAALGAMFATLRGDRVIAVDANPDRGTLGERVPRESGATVRHLLEARDRLMRYADVRHFTSQSPTRLEVLASDADPSASLAYSEKDYRDTVATLERFYNLILTDCGTGLLHSAMAGILGLANSLVVVSSASLDGARSASATLDWLEAHGRDDLARNAVVVISSVRPGGGIVDVLQLEDHFAARCRAVVTIPYDPHLEAGGVLDLEELAPDTSEAYYELAAAVAQGFGPAR